MHNRFFFFQTEATDQISRTVCRYQTADERRSYNESRSVRSGRNAKAHVSDAGYGLPSSDSGFDAGSAHRHVEGQRQSEVLARVRGKLLKLIRGCYGARTAGRLKIAQFLLLCRQSIEPGQQFTWDHSSMEINKRKNRYANVIAYDHSRVVLQDTEGILGGDYINANYCDGYRKHNAYIATQVR